METLPIFILTSSLEATHQYHSNSVSQTIFVHFVTLCGVGTQPTARIKAFCYLKQLLCHFYLLPLLIFLAIHSVAEYEFVFEIQDTIIISNIFRNKSKLSALYIPLKIIIIYYYLFTIQTFTRIWPQNACSWMVQWLNVWRWSSSWLTKLEGFQAQNQGRCSDNSSFNAHQSFKTL